MKQFLKLICISIILCGFNQQSFAQKYTFQKIYKRDFPTQTLNCTALKDGGYAMIGIADTTGGSFVRLTKLKCDGEVEWVREFGTSSTANNVSPRVIDTRENDIVVVSNTGSFNNYAMIVIRIGYDGIVKWKKRMVTVGETRGQALVETQDGGFAVAGMTKSYGTDVLNNWSDVYLVKFDATGEVLWSKTYGNNKNIDEAYGIAEDAYGNLLTTGRYIVDGTFYSFLLKTNAEGVAKFLKAYGAANQSTTGYDVLVTKDQKNYVITGGTTINKSSFQDYHDVFVIKTDTAGNPVFSKIYYSISGTDGSDSGTSVVEESTGDFAIGVATFSFSNHTVGFVPNKNAVFRISPVGNLNKAVLYNQGGSHYTKLQPAYDGGYILSAFTNLNISQGLFTPLFIKMDEDFDSGCNQIVVTNELATQSDGWDIQSAPHSSETGGVFLDAPKETKGSYLNSEAYCSNFPELSVQISGPDQICQNSKGEFLLTTNGSVIGTTWNFGDQTIVAGGSAASHTYSQPGNYVLSVTITDGCKESTATKNVVVDPVVTTLQQQYICEGDSILINGTYVHIAGMYSDTIATAKCDSIVNTLVFLNPLETINIDSVLCMGDSIKIGNIQITEAGVYKDTIAGTPCKKIALYNITVKECNCTLAMPNVFTPNGDGKNDHFRPYAACPSRISNYSLKVFNRWGKQVFESENVKEGWDGLYNDSPAPTDVYVYVVSYHFNNEETTEPVQIKGDISLLR